MRAVTWHGNTDVRVETVPDPQILLPTDAVVRVTSTAICGSDLHLYGGYVPSMMPGDILGHEFMGIVEEVGKDVRKLKVGDRVVVPFLIACGECYFCKKGLFSACDNSNPNAKALEVAYGYGGAALFGYSHLYGGYAGGQAEYVRVPFADVGPVVVPQALSDEQVLFLTDVFPTGFMAAENCGIEPGDTVAVFGCGAVGQFAARSALMLGARRVIAIDRVPERLEMVARQPGVETLNYEQTELLAELKDMTGGRGPDSCIDAVGMEAHGHGISAAYDYAKHFARVGTDRPIALRWAIQACRKAGTISVPGVYGGLLDKLNFGAAFAKALTFRMGQTHMQRYVGPLLERVNNAEIDPSFLTTHRVSLEQAPEMYAKFRAKQDGCIKVVMKPGIA